MAGQHASKPAGKRLGKIAGETMLNLAALGGLICIVLVALSFFFNISLIMFKTGSMSPTIEAGAVAVVQQIDASQIRVGDVVSVNRENALPVTHRVTSVSGEGDGAGNTRTITMKGDANEAEDPLPYTVTDVRRVMFSVPGLAKVIVAFSNPLVLGGITVAASVLVTWAFWPRDARDPAASRPRTAERSGGRERQQGEQPQPDQRQSERSPSGSGLTILAVVLVASGLTATTSAPAQAATPLSLAAVETVVTQGKYITLTSIGDAEAM
ncbi:MAG: signal peptidase I, partial [Leucobacter sp.]|nr:signal peptidase I [Leucobacter sp.]